MWRLNIQYSSSQKASDALCDISADTKCPLCDVISGKKAVEHAPLFDRT